MCKRVPIRRFLDPGSGVIAALVVSLFESGTKLKDVVATIQQRHPALGDLWFTGIGRRLMFTESQVLVRILLALIDRDITALPIHDCLVVAEPVAAEVEQVMVETFEEITAQPAKVSRE